MVVIVGGLILLAGTAACAWWWMWRALFQPTVPLRETYLRVNTAERVSWTTELALAWEGRAPHSRD